MNYWDQANAVAVDGNGNVFVTGSSGASGPSYTDYDFVTIEYSSVSPPPVRLSIERDGGAAYFIRFYGSPGSTHRLQRAASATRSVRILKRRTYHCESPASKFGTDFRDGSSRASAWFEE